MKKINKLNYFIIFIVFSCSIQAKTLHGKIVRVVDGDTAWLLDNKNHQTKIRFFGIDAPEKAQPFGMKAKYYLANLIFQKKVKVVGEGNDMYGRFLGTVYYNGENINYNLVANGYAWKYRFTNDSKLDRLQAEAKAKKLNLWSQDKPQEPYLFRKSKKHRK